jgi:ribosome maturation factor RimP
VQDTVERLGCQLVAVELTGGPGRTILRLSIDAAQGVSVGQCTAISRAISPLLDVNDPMPVPYDLEVSSPGMDRPLELLADFERYAGHRMLLRLGGDKRKRQGVLRGVEEGQVQFAIGDRIELIHPDRIDRASLILDPEEFARLAPVRVDGAQEGESP